MTEIERVRRVLMARVDAYQGLGGLVRNDKIVRKVGGPRGLSWEPASGPDGPGAVCLLGVMGGSRFEAYKALEITPHDAAQIEHGFEDWRDEHTDFESEFYKLGREVGLKLEQEAGAG